MLLSFAIAANRGGLWSQDGGGKTPICNLSG